MQEIIQRRIFFARNPKQEPHWHVAQLRVEHRVLPNIDGLITAELMHTKNETLEPTGRYFLVQA